MNYKQEIREWMYSEKWDIEATFTFAKDVTPLQVQNSMRLYWFNVSKCLYRRALRKHNKRCEQFSFYEMYSDDTNTHCHSIIKLPINRFDDTESYCRYLRNKWQEMCGRNIIIKITKIRQNQKEWIDYITKDLGKDNCDSLDLHCSFITPKVS